jgi:hypothetical protein
MVSVLLDAFDGGASCPCSPVDVAHRLPVRLDMFTSWMVGADESLIPLLMRAQIHMALIGGEVRFMPCVTLPSTPRVPDTYHAHSCTLRDSALKTSNLSLSGSDPTRRL